MVVKEGSNVTLKCSATGSPPPTITFRREDGEPIKLPGGLEGKILNLCVCGCVGVQCANSGQEMPMQPAINADKVCMLCRCRVEYMSVQYMYMFNCLYK